MQSTVSHDDRIVITGIGIATALGNDRETVWQRMQRGISGIGRIAGIAGIPNGMMLAAMAHVESDYPGQLKNIPLTRSTAAEALFDSGIDLDQIDRDRFGSSIGAHMGDDDYVTERPHRYDLIPSGKHPWFEQWLPNTACAMVSQELDLRGPRLSNSTACATGTIAILKAVRALRDGQCDIALAGSSEAIHPLFAAGFHNMGVLAEHDDPTQASRPFDANRTGFVMGEGAAMMVLERLEHARARRAPIYAEVLGGRMLSDGRHMTSLDAASNSLVELITYSLRSSGLVPRDVTHVNAHGTGTTQNDLMEAHGIRRAFGRATESLCVSANKSMLGHLVNASGSVELALMAPALRDGYAPPTINLTHPDPECDIDCVPLVGRKSPFEHAMKLSIAFGGHLAAIVLRRWDGAEARAALSVPVTTTSMSRAAA